MEGPYPYWGPTGILDHINEYSFNGEFALIGEDGDHFLKFETQSMTQWATGRFNVNNHAHVIASGPRCTARWFYYAFMHTDLRPWLTLQGVARQKLTRWELANLRMPVPCSDEQKRITEALDEDLAQDRIARSRIQDQLALLNEYRQALITAAVTGQLDIPGADP